MLCAQLFTRLLCCLGVENQRGTGRHGRRPLFESAQHWIHSVLRPQRPHSVSIYLFTHTHVLYIFHIHTYLYRCFTSTTSPKCCRLLLLVPNRRLRSGVVKIQRLHLNVIVSPTKHPRRLSIAHLAVHGHGTHS